MNIATMNGVVLIFTGGHDLRDRIVSVIPDLAGLYKLAGIDINRRGLEFTGIKQGPSRVKMIFYNRLWRSAETK